MNKRIKIEWVSLLRYAGIAQAKGRLKRHDGALCCLGVLCEMAVAEGVVTEDNGLFRPKEDLNGGGSHEFLPPTVQKWAGLDDGSPEIKRVRLSYLNDGGVPFTDIADMIEEGL